jgi:hypothetical protein
MASFTIPSFLEVRGAVGSGCTGLDVASFTISSFRGVPRFYVADHDSPKAFLSSPACFNESRLAELQPLVY